MTRMSSNQVAMANSPGAGSVTRFTQVGSTNFSIINAFKEMFEKPAAVLADKLGISDRTAKRKLSCERELSAEEIGKLIRSEQGFAFITAIMADAPRAPAWWKVCAPVMEAAEIRKMQMAAQKRVTKILEGALDADKSLTAAIARADALAVHDEDFARPHGDALRSMARVPNRAVAEAKGSKRPYAGRGR